MVNLGNSVSWIFAKITELICVIWNSLWKLRHLLVPNHKLDADPLAEVEEFYSYLEYLPTQHSTSNADNPSGPKKLPFLERSTYGQLMDSLRKNPRYMIIYLHDHYSSHSHNFCSSLICYSETEKFFLEKNCNMWACSYQSAEGRRVCRALQARSFPFVALIGFKRLIPIMLFKIPGCEIGPNELLRKLARVMNDNQIHLEQAILERREIDGNNSIRLAQDIEYNQSLAADREKERLKRLNEEKKENKTKVDLSKQEEKERFKEGMRIKLLPEPDHLQDATRVLIRLPNGTRLERRFSRKYRLEQLFIFILLQEMCCDDFEVVTHFPRRLVPCDTRKFYGDGAECSSMTFEEFGFQKTETLFVNDL